MRWRAIRIAGCQRALHATLSGPRGIENSLALPLACRPPTMQEVDGVIQRSYILYFTRQLL